ncbi:DUF6372 family protein [Streptomyces sp. NPDC002232]|uniref:DUF6372 family protein n=1 Tax=Streptomyces sp. NPDC002232 TaxID=3364640 RepID=UPI0036CA5BF4
MSNEGEVPVIFLVKRWLFTWEQHRPGGCRCVCGIYHGGSGTCSAAAEPGRLLRVVTRPELESFGPADITAPLPLCDACYIALAPLSEPEGDPLLG